MKLISFSMTTEAFLAGTKTVTRRLGWRHLKVGDRLVAVEKCQGLSRGEKVRRFGEIEILDVRRERLDAILSERRGAAAEGFPELSPRAFVAKFCEAMRCKPWDEITRIEFGRLVDRDSAVQRLEIESTGFSSFGIERALRGDS